VARVNDDPSVTVTRIANGMYRVEHEGRNEIVYVAGSAADRWIFWNGEVYRGTWGGPEQLAGPRKDRPAAAAGARARTATQSLTAPMPARVIRILVQPGSDVKKGDTLILLEAMKMELPIRAPGDASVKAVHCHEGELVDADAVLIELR
jgi:biotin carboxyl carrier protein